MAIKNFITEEYFRNEYGSKAKIEITGFDLQYYFQYASEAIFDIINKKGLFSDDETDAIEYCTAILSEHWLIQGTNVTRATITASLGSFSSSVAPDRPEFIPGVIYTKLQRVNLWKKWSTLNAVGISQPTIISQPLIDQEVRITTLKLINEGLENQQLVNEHFDAEIEGIGVPSDDEVVITTPDFINAGLTDQKLWNENVDGKVTFNFDKNLEQTTLIQNNTEQILLLSSLGRGQVGFMESPSRLVNNGTPDPITPFPTPTVGPTDTTSLDVDLVNGIFIIKKNGVFLLQWKGEYTNSTATNITGTYQVVDFDTTLPVYEDNFVAVNNQGLLGGITPYSSFYQIEINDIDGTVITERRFQLAEGHDGGLTDLSISEQASYATLDGGTGGSATPLSGDVSITDTDFWIPTTLENAKQAFNKIELGYDFKNADGSVKITQSSVDGLKIHSPLLLFEDLAIYSSTGWAAYCPQGLNMNNVDIIFDERGIVMPENFRIGQSAPFKIKDNKPPIDVDDLSNKRYVDDGDATNLVFITQNANDIVSLQEQVALQSLAGTASTTFNNPAFRTVNSAKTLLTTAETPTTEIRTDLLQIDHGIGDHIVKQNGTYLFQIKVTLQNGYPAPQTITYSLEDKANPGVTIGTSGEIQLEEINNSIAPNQLAWAFVDIIDIDNVTVFEKIINVFEQYGPDTGSPITATLAKTWVQLVSLIPESGGTGLDVSNPEGGNYIVDLILGDAPLGSINTFVVPIEWTGIIIHNSNPNRLTPNGGDPFSFDIVDIFNRKVFFHFHFQGGRIEMVSSVPGIGGNVALEPNFPTDFFRNNSNLNTSTNSTINFQNFNTNLIYEADSNISMDFQLRFSLDASSEISSVILSSTDNHLFKIDWEFERQEIILIKGKKYLRDYKKIIDIIDENKNG